MDCPCRVIRCVDMRDGSYTAERFRIGPGGVPGVAGSSFVRLGAVAARAVPDSSFERAEAGGNLAERGSHR